MGRNFCIFKSNKKIGKYELFNYGGGAALGQGGVGDGSDIQGQLFDKATDYFDITQNKFSMLRFHEALQLAQRKCLEFKNQWKL